MGNTLDECQNETDVLKIEQLRLGILFILLQDNSTFKNIIWATNNYEGKKETDEIKIDDILNNVPMSTTKIGTNIKIRANKDDSNCKERTKSRAEVFTPSWVCRDMNKHLDEEWKKNNPDAKWTDYVKLKVIEITCGEAPFLTSRYDAATGEPLTNVEERYGLLDKKLNLISKNVSNKQKWEEWALTALRCTYGYEYQGDNLLIARINLFETVAEFYYSKFKKTLPYEFQKNVARTIIENVVQMDGLTQTIPFSDEPVEVYQKFSHGSYYVKFKDIIEGSSPYMDKNKKAFTFCVGNAPYQVSDGGAQASATPVYQHFSEQAKKIASINCLIQPSRWMTGGKGLDKYRKTMLSDKSIKLLKDYANSKDVFENVDIKGGVCIYLRDDNYSGPCKCIRINADGESSSSRYLQESEEDDVFIREPILVNIKNKVCNKEFVSFEGIVSARKPYGLLAETMQNATKYGLPEFCSEKQPDGYTIWGLINKHRGCKYLPKDYPFPKVHENINKYKVFVAEAYGCGEIGEEMSTPILSTPNVVCTETFLQIGGYDTQNEAENLLKYIKTKFLRVMVGIRKQTQHTTQKVYRYVPLQDFTENSDIDWSKPIAEIDQQLYKKYNLSDEEINFIETHVKEME